MLPSASNPTRLARTQVEVTQESFVYVRINLEAREHRVHDLTPDGFSIAAIRPFSQGTSTHAAFKVPGGLTISVEAVAAWCDDGAPLQWFQFVDADREVIGLLMMALATTGVH